MKPAILIFLAAVPLRLYWAIHGFRAQVSPIYLEQLGDGGEYVRLALNLRYHLVFSPVGSLEPTAFRAPLYPLFIAILNNLLYVYLAQVIIGALTCVLVYLTARQKNERIAWIAGLMMALAPMSAWFTGKALTETLFTFLLMVAVYFWGARRYRLAGVGLGLAALTRPVLLPFLLLVIVLGLLFKRRELLVLTLFACLTIAPWTIRNAIVFHRFIPIAQGGWGTNLLFGTLDSGVKVDWAAMFSHPAVVTDLGYYDPRKESLYLGRAIERIRSSPWGWIKVRVKQYPRLFLDTGAYMMGWFGPLWPVVKYLLLLGNLLLPVLTVLAVFRLRFWDNLHLTLFPLFLFAFQLPLWTESRYSLPAVPLMIILSLHTTPVSYVIKSRELTREAS